MHPVLAGLILALGACTTSERSDDVGVLVNWRIEREVGGGRSCSDASATTVEWLIRGSDGSSTVESFGCTEGTHVFVIPEGIYTILGMLHGADDTVLDVCVPAHDRLLVLDGGDDVDACVFRVPGLPDLP
jgi:hypothetical protein